METDGPIDSQTRIGHVHLKVANLQRAFDFYCGVLSFELMQRYGSQAAFMSAGGSKPTRCMTIDNMLPTAEPNVTIPARLIQIVAAMRFRLSAPR